MTDRPAREDALGLADARELEPLMQRAARLRDSAHHNFITYSRKVFLPLTHLCRDACKYCVFAQPPRPGEPVYMSHEALLAQARAGARAGCKEALFTLGDQPELRWPAARAALAELGHASTLSYLREAAELVHQETGLLPHLNPGLLTARDLAALRPVSASMGLMLESVSERLLEKGQAHQGCPDKVPARRLETLRLAGEASIPFTTGILIGIGETRRERILALLALRDLHDRYGHIQEVIIQSFRAKPGTPMAGAPDATLEDLLWTVAVARLVLGPDMNLQAPPNLSPRALHALVAAGINDWGGISPVTRDFVNPEAPWPHLEALASETARAGKQLCERLCIYPRYAREGARWLDQAMRPPVVRAIDADGLARVDPWAAGGGLHPALDRAPAAGAASADLDGILERARAGEELLEAEIVRLFQARGRDLGLLCAAADQLRAQASGEVVTYVVNRNINYTNVCSFACGFCAFAKGRGREHLRGRPYRLELDEIVGRAREAWQRGATEVCLQGGIHPEYSGQTYLEICRAIKRELPALHVHAFSPLEVWQGAQTLGLEVAEFLRLLREAGLGTLPGTAAEILDDEVRSVLCPDKIKTGQWLEVMETAHGLGIRTTSTIMFGHLEGPRSWARHLLSLRRLQRRTGGFTELVPLPFVHMAAPIYLKGLARKGPTFREALLMHAVARLVLHPYIRNIQTSWVKMGRQGVLACLGAGANDLGGTLMEESITRAAGAGHGQELPPHEMERLIRSLGRTARQRTTLYGTPPAERIQASFAARPLGERRC